LGVSLPPLSQRQTRPEAGPWRRNNTPFLLSYSCNLID